MLTGFRRFQLVSLALELDVPKHLAAGTLSLEELSERTGSPPDRLRRLLRGMVWADILQQDSAGGFVLTEVGMLLVGSGPATIDSFFRINSQIYYHGWGALRAFSESGSIPFENFNGEPVFDHMSKNPDLRDLFHGEMKTATAKDAKAIAATHPFPETGRILDIGGGFGQLISQILHHHPGLQGAVFDLPALRDDAVSFLSENGLTDRCSFQAGSIFEPFEPNEPADLYLLKWVLHDWDDEACLRILSNCAQTMSDDTRLLVIERLMPETTSPNEDMVQRDLNMLVLNGGQERTLEEYGALFARAGLNLESTTTGPNGFSILTTVRN
ncbi:MAG: hypothetical protein ACI9R3_002913 [Verrucomicrobiales bacterium]|jgi:hypothetical protein